MTFREIFQKASGQLKDAGIESNVLDAEVIISHVADIERHRILIDADKEVDFSLQEEIFRLIEKRCKNIPVSYLTGYREFYSLNFEVNENVLIPRPETELLVDMAIYHAPQKGSVLDLCTGSGCVAISLKHSRRDLSVSASDISPDAIECARVNCEAILGEGEIEFRQGDLFSPWREDLFDAIISNPPYVNPGIKNTLQQDLTYEPSIALYCDDEGRSIIRKIIEESSQYLSESGIVMLEIGSDMKSFVVELGRENGYGVMILNDFSGLPRIATFRKFE